MDRKYNLKLDLQFRCNNSKMVFDEFDENTSDFFMQITRQGEKIDISNTIPTLLVLKPGGAAVSQILNIKDNLIYGNLENSLKDEVGTYIAKLMLVEGDKKTFISNISYEVTENALLGKIDNDIVEDERYSVLIQLLERLSNIELQEQTRIDNENSRVEAEKLREAAIEKIKNDITDLINEINKKVNDNLNPDISKIDDLIIETKEELNKYKENKDRFINENLEEFKENTNKSIDNYKASKDIEIDNALNAYKTNTTNDINNFKNTINGKIDKYKNDKDKAINEYIEGKSLELDNYVEAKNSEIDEYKTSKNNEIDLYISEKNTLIDSKISEVDTAKEQLQNSVNNKLIEVDNAEQIRQQEHESRQQLLNGFEGKLNTVVDDVVTIKDDVVAAREANKRQDIFLQGLYNENLDGRVTVKEEGSVISLTNSDDGLVDIIGLEGKTLVNYCTDGTKELTLNGDIDVEETNVTLTEGVDNGKVDVVCEGNTLINLFDKNIPFTKGEHQNIEGANIYYQKEIPMATNGTFHIIAPIEDKSFNSNDARFMILKYNKTNNTSTVVRDYAGNSNSSLNLVVSLTSEEVLLFNCLSIADDNFNRNYPTMMVLEGDWTNKPIPPYFEGMKSVAECENNKIEILLQNKNLFDGELELGSISTSHGGNTTNTRCIRSKNYIKVRPNTTIIQSNDLGYESIIYIYDKDKNLIAHLGSKHSFTIPGNGEYIRFRSSTGNSENNLNVKYQFEEGSVATSYVPHSNNKKEISLSEPLRGLPNGVKDKIVKIGGKWYIHRRLYGITLNGGENEKWNIGFTDFGTPVFTWNNTGVNICRTESYFSVLSDRFIYGKQYSSTEENHKCIYVYNYEGLDDSIKIQYPLNSVEEFRTYLSSNPINVIIQLEVPIYEELPIDPTLNTYNDITHISNNSTIPCNMKIQNSGYNAIIKPNTKYTVAFDTNKIGEVGINLGGSKVTTTNNVATVTTPSILTDDSLRLTGKGIKASKIRLLEGDKTNWIPSHFEGMESCFKDNNIEIKVKSGDKENSINIQLNEPLRGIGNFKDRLVFKDGKLMIERNCGAREYQEGDLELDSSFTDKINTIYVLSEPYYEEVSYEAQKLILEGYENGTLFIDTNIPPTVTASYTTNVPVVSKLNKVNETTETNTEDIAITQMAVDFLLMSTLGEEMLNFKIKRGTNMSAYFASRIIKGALKYEDVVKKYHQYKEDIDLILISEGYSDLIVEL